MNLFYTIKQTLEQVSEDKLLRSMGYNNLKKGHLTLKQFLDTADIYLWLKKGAYDLKYSSEEFIEKLIETLSLTSIGKDELNQCYRRLDAISAMRNRPYIFIDTHFKRAQQPIFALAFMEGRRHIRIDKEWLVFKSEKEILEIIGDIIKEHHASHHGKLDLWGKIYTYIYHSPDGRKFTFDIDGALSQNQGEIMESRAEIRIGNQILGGIGNE